VPTSRHPPLGTQLIKLEPSGGLIRIGERLWDAGWPTFKRWLESRRPENRIRLSFEAFHLYVEAADKGRADFRILVINFSGIPLSVQHVEMHWWRLANRVLAEPSELLKASGSVVNVQSADSAFFSIKLGAADIRDIASAIEPSQNLKSAPRVRLEFNVTVAFRYKNREVRIRHNFEVECICVYIPTAIIQRLEASS